MPKKPAARGGRSNNKQIRVGPGGTYVRGNSTQERMGTVTRHADTARRAVRESRGSDEAAFERSTRLHEAFISVARQADRRREDARADARKAPTRGGGPASRPRGRPRTR